MVLEDFDETKLSALVNDLCVTIGMFGTSLKYLSKKTKSLLVGQNKNGLTMTVSLLDRHSTNRRGIAF